MFNIKDSDHSLYRRPGTSRKSLFSCHQSTKTFKNFSTISTRKEKRYFNQVSLQCLQFISISSSAWILLDYAIFDQKKIWGGGTYDAEFSVHFCKLYTLPTIVGLELRTICVGLQGMRFLSILYLAWRLDLYLATRTREDDLLPPSRMRICKRI